MSTVYCCMLCTSPLVNDFVGQCFLLLSSSSNKMDNVTRTGRLGENVLSGLRVRRTSSQTPKNQIDCHPLLSQNSLFNSTRNCSPSFKSLQVYQWSLDTEKNAVEYSSDWLDQTAVVDKGICVSIYQLCDWTRTKHCRAPFESKIQQWTNQPTIYTVSSGERYISSTERPLPQFESVRYIKIKTCYCLWCISDELRCGIKERARWITCRHQTPLYPHKHIPHGVVSNVTRRKALSAGKEIARMVFACKMKPINSLEERKEEDIEEEKWDTWLIPLSLSGETKTVILDGFLWMCISFNDFSHLSLFSAIVIPPISQYILWRWWKTSAKEC